MAVPQDVSKGSIRGMSAIGVVVVALAIGFLSRGPRQYPHLHAFFDSGAFLLSGMLWLLFWDMGQRLGRPIKQWLAWAFAAAALFEFLHALVVLDWFSALLALDPKRSAHLDMWLPAAHVLPIGIAGALWLHRRGTSGVSGFVLALAAVCVMLVAVNLASVTYTSDNSASIARPWVAAVPLLWAGVGLACWRMRATDRILPTMAWMSLLLMLGYFAMLFSQTPNDTWSMLAHLAKVSGYFMVMLALMQFASQDMVERIAAENELAKANLWLEDRVIERTHSLELENQSRRGAELKLEAQLERMNLLHHITRAIGERQDIRSIFQVVLRSVEDHLPVDLACIGLREGANPWIDVACVGVRGESLALELALGEHSRIDVDQNGLSLCLRGQLVYEADIDKVPMPFPQRLARGGLRAMVLAPLQIESQVFGVLLVARRQAGSFGGDDCEFLRQLSEHVALASHQARLHDALKQAYDDLRLTQNAIMQQERLKALGQMASGIAHDINNAISPAAIYAESLLETEPGLSSRAREQLQLVQRAIDDVAKTVARMREFYRDREPTVEFRPVRLDEIAQQVLDLTRARWHDMPQKNGHVISVTREFEAELPAVLGAENEVREALTNLIFNAVDAMPRGGTLTLRANAAREGHDARAVRLEVVDTGIGMDEATRLRCMEPFFTTKGERGTGLGLAMVYGVAQRHGAEVEIDSTPGVGTTMRMVFPVPDNIATAPRDTPIDTRVARQRVLVIDDDPLLLRSLRDVLETDGHQVVCANGGQEGITVFKAAQTEQRFDLVITDLGMPRVDGRQVIGAIKAASPTTPVILLTGWGQRLIDSGEVPPLVDRVLSKPPKLRELREAIARCVRGVAAKAAG